MSTRVYCNYVSSGKYVPKIKLSTFVKENGDQQMRSFPGYSKKTLYSNYNGDSFFCIYSFEIPEGQDLRSLFFTITSDKNVTYSSTTNLLDVIPEIRVHFFFGLSFERNLEEPTYKDPPGKPVASALDELKWFFEGLYQEEKGERLALQALIVQSVDIFAKIGLEHKKYLFNWIFQNSTNNDDTKKLTKSLFLNCFSISEIIKQEHIDIQEIEKIIMKLRTKDNFFWAMCTELKNLFKPKFIKEYKIIVQDVSQKLFGVLLIKDFEIFKKVSQQEDRDFIDKFITLFCSSFLKNLSFPLHPKKHEKLINQLIKEKNFKFLFENSPSLVDCLSTVFVEIDFLSKDCERDLVECMNNHISRITQSETEIDKYEGFLEKYLEEPKPNHKQQRTIIEKHLPTFFGEMKEKHCNIKSMLQFNDKFLLNGKWEPYFDNDKEFKVAFHKKILENIIEEKPFSYSNIKQILEFKKKNEMLIEKFHKDDQKNIEKIKNLQKKQEEYTNLIEKIKSDKIILKLIKSSLKTHDEFDQKIEVIFGFKFYEKEESIWCPLISSRKSESLNKLWDNFGEFLDRESKKRLACDIMSESLKLKSSKWDDFLGLCEKFQWLPERNKFFNQFLSNKSKELDSNKFIVECINKSDYKKSFAIMIQAFLNEYYKGEESDKRFNDLLQAISKMYLMDDEKFKTVNLVFEKNSKYSLQLEDVWRSEKGTRLEIVKSIEQRVSNGWILSNELIKNTRETCKKLRTSIIDKTLSYKELFALRNFNVKEREFRLKIINFLLDSEDRVPNEKINELILLFENYAQSIKTLEIFSKTFLNEFIQEIDIEFSTNYYTKVFKKQNLSNFKFPDEIKEVLEASCFIEMSFESLLFQHIIKKMKEERKKKKENPLDENKEGNKLALQNEDEIPADKKKREENNKKQMSKEDKKTEILRHIALAIEYQKRFNELYDLIFKSFEGGVKLIQLSEIFKSFSKSNMEKEFKLVVKLRVYNNYYNDLKANIPLIVEEEDIIRFAKTFVLLPKLFKVISEDKKEIENKKKIDKILEMKDNKESYLELDVSVYIKLLKELKEITEYNYWNKYMNKLNSLSEAREILEFLAERKYNDIKFLIEDFDEVDENYFFISKLESLFIFYNKIKQEVQSKGGTSNLFKTLKPFLDDKSIFDLEKLPIIIDKTEAIKEIFLEATNNTEANKIKVKKMMKEFSVKIKLNASGSGLSCVFTIGKNEIDFQEIKENRDKLHLTSNDIKNKYSKFVSMVNDLEIFVSNLEDLYTSGANTQVEYTFKIVDMDYSQWDSKKMAQEKKKWREKVEKEQANNFLSTLYYGRQIPLLSSLFENRAENYSTMGLIKFIFGRDKIESIAGGGLPKEIFENLPKDRKDESTFDNVILISENISHYLKEENLYKNNHPDIRQNKLEPKFGELRGDIKLILPEKDVEMALLSIFMTITRNPPMPQTVLLCNQHTKKDHITCFLNRFFRCSIEATVFAIVNFERLTQTVKNHFEETLLSLQNIFHRGQIATLLIFTASRDSQFNSKIMSLEKSKINLNQFIKTVHDFKPKNEVFLVTSEYSGLGKSFFIRKAAITKGIKHVYFPISGEIMLDIIVKRFLGLNLEERQACVLHIDVEEVSEQSVSRLNELLFSLLVLRGLFYMEDIFYLPNKVLVYLELSMSVISNKQFQINFLINEEIKITADITKYPLEVSSDSDLLDLTEKENIKLVANYLKHFKANTLSVTTIKSDNLENISDDEARALIQEKFNKSNESIDTYYQKFAFINSLADQLKKFSDNACFEVVSLRESGLDLQIRTEIFLNLLNNTSFFVKLHYKNLLSRQLKNLESFKNKIKDLSQEGDIKKDDKNKIDKNKDDENKDTIRFSKMGDEFIFCIFDVTSISIYPIQKKKEKIPANLIKLYKIQENNKLNEEQLRTKFDYNAKSNDELITEFCSIFHKQAKPTVKDYVFTADNFLKMNLIYLKICSKIPVIMEGETGCGKTSLLKIMVQSLLNEHMVTINFHAGITQIILEEKLKEIFKVFEHPKYENRRVWIFLDEINTCDCLGMISELMIKRTLNGGPISKNFIFVAACNPFRMKRNNSMQVGIKTKKDMGTLLLAYRVKPLPISLMNFVFDFGSLQEEDEIRYIKCMIGSLGLNRDHEELCLNCLVISQEFIREKEEASSVSLRDIKRFTVIYLWFKNMFSKTRQDYKEYTKDEKALVLSLFTGYYFKLNKRDDRKEYLSQLLTKFRSNLNLNKNFNSESDLKRVYDDEVNFYLDNMEIPEGIARNESLKENIFVLLVCVCNGIPVIISGKPGCSKTLSANLIQDNMNGKNSRKDFFKKLPRVYFKSYQGSLSSTSEEIEKVFESAYKKNREVLKKNNAQQEGAAQKSSIDDEDIKIIVFFDELGLAEISPNNPLKILHGLLEPEINDLEKHVGFIGISNWCLDASKINRVIYLAKPDPEEEDLKKTAREIALSFGKEMKSYAAKFEEVAQNYHSFKKIEKENDDFHGTRDFYSCIKLICSMIKNGKDLVSDNIDQIIRHAVSRNFGGLSESVSEFLQKDISNDNEKVPVFNLIKENVCDLSARYLMIITKNRSNIEVLSEFLKEYISESMILVGSSFEVDIRDEEYSFRILSLITDCTEKGKKLVLQNLSNIYPTLYDLFNQNFKTINKEKRCRIALGYKNNSFCPVHSNFKCIVLIDKKDLENQDPPFLNRFEKQLLDFKSELKEDEMNIAENLKSTLKNSLYNKTSIPILLKLKKILLNYQIEEVYALIYMMRFNSNKIEDGKQLENSYEKLLRLATGDFLLAIDLRESEPNKDKESLDALEFKREIYFRQNHESLADYLKKQVHY